MKAGYFQGNASQKLKYERMHTLVNKFYNIPLALLGCCSFSFFCM